MTLQADAIVFPAGLRADGLPAALSDPIRLAAIDATGLLDTEPDNVLDDLARLAATLTGCARAFITLVDDHRSFWKSCIGVDSVTDTQNPVRESFCYFLVGLEGEPFVIDDAATDPRTRDHPSVTPMQIGAWAGYPIVSPGGQVLGSMCVIDDVPHHWQPDELTSLATLARAASNEIHLRLSLATAERAQAASAELARSLQESLLPPRLEHVPGLDTAAAYVAASGDTVLGDFYDLFQIRGPWWCAVLGDVCGHGVEAAKVTALARYTLRAEASRDLSPAKVLEQLNAAMITQRGHDRFLTAAYANFRTTSSGVSGRLCTAGHPPALIRRADGRVQQLGKPGSLLGVLDKVTVTDVRFRLAPGDTLLLYTDGAVEARPRAAQSSRHAPQFGEEALAEVLAGCYDLDAAQTVARIGDVLDRHTQGWAGDDTALLAIRVPNSPGTGSPGAPSRPQVSHESTERTSQWGLSSHAAAETGGEAW